MCSPCGGVSSSTKLNFFCCVVPWCHKLDERKCWRAILRQAMVLLPLFWGLIYSTWNQLNQWPLRSLTFLEMTVHHLPTRSSLLHHPKIPRPCGSSPYSVLEFSVWARKQDFEKNNFSTRWLWWTFTYKSIFSFAAVYEQAHGVQFSDHVTLFFRITWQFFWDYMGRIEPLWTQISNGGFTTLLVLTVKYFHFHYRHFTFSCN